MSSRARAGRADGANLMPNRGAAEGAVGLKGFSPPASRPQFAVDYQPKLSTTSPKHAMGISLLAGGGARSIPPFSPQAGRPGAEPAAAEGRQRRGRASVSPLFGAAGQAAPEFSACGTAVVIAERDSPAETPPGGDAPPAAPASEGSGS